MSSPKNAHWEIVNWQLHREPLNGVTPWHVRMSGVQEALCGTQSPGIGVRTYKASAETAGLDLDEVLRYIGEEDCCRECYKVVFVMYK